MIVKENFLSNEAFTKNMTFRNRAEVELADPANGTVEELVTSENLTMARLILTGETRPHSHDQMEEAYFIIKGRGRLVVGPVSNNIEPQETWSIPKGAYHYLQRSSKEPLEVMIVTASKYDLSNVVQNKKR